MRRLTLLLILLPLLTIAAQNPSEWFAWVHSQQANRLILLNQGGEVLNMPSPTHPNEDSFAQRYFGISRDGARLAMLSSTTDFRPLLIFRDLNTGAEASWIGEVDEWSLPSLGSQHAIPTLTFNPDGLLFAIGIANPQIGTWRVMVYDTASGGALFQLNETSPEAQAFLQAQPQSLSSVMPVVRLFDQTDVHVQMISVLTEGISNYPAFRWSPGDNRMEASPYDRAFMDVSEATGQMVFPDVDASMPLPESFGPVPPFNAIHMPTGGPPLWVSPSELILQTRWAASDRVILAQTQDPNAFTSSWKLIQTWDGGVIPLPPTIADVRGVRDGLLSIEVGTGVVAFHPIDNPLAARPLTVLSPSDDVHEIIWTSAGPYNGAR
jgi:hypothetical protein